MALFFDSSEQFGLEKPAGVPCPHLDAACACTIYEARAEKGFGGCIAYDCHGAGQRVTQEIFGGRTWADDPALLAPMTIAFGTLGSAHRLLLLLSQANGLALSPEDRAALTRLAGEIAAAGDAAERIGALGSEVSIFLKSLQSYLTATTERPA
jgi:hypothetical protein